MTEAAFLLTGATSGLGLEAATALARAAPGSELLVGARRPETADALKAAVPENQLWLAPLDLASLGSVKAFAAAVRARLGARKLAGVALNAGVQIVSAKQLSPDGHEMTFAANVLGHGVLYRLLSDLVSPQGVVVSTASGTHDPEHPLAVRHGFRGGVFPSIEAVAAGDLGGGDPAQQGRDRYATSKLCNVLFSYAMARRASPAGPRFLAYDPGLMPGTSLARDQAASIQWAWKHVLPLITRGQEGVSTPQRSGQILADLLLARILSDRTGANAEFTGRERASSTLSHDRDKQDALMAFIDAAARA